MSQAPSTNPAAASSPPHRKLRWFHRERLRSELGFALRVVGLAIGLFALTNLGGELLRPRFDTTHTWIGGLFLPPIVFRLLEALAAIGLCVFAIRPFGNRALRLFAATCVGVGALCAAYDVVAFYKALARGAIHGSSVVPASAVVFALLLSLSVSIALERRERPPLSRQRLLAMGAGVGLGLFLMPLLLMFTFGPTRYERRADCAIVFGARVWDNGTPSDALADRIDESIRLYQNGFVGAIVMSGAIDTHNGFSEPEVMRARAMRSGVPSEHIFLDEAGVDTASTVRNSALLMQKNGFHSALAVTHYYHEPRTKMLFERASVTTYTVPAKMSRRLLKEPYFIAREVLAYWHSFFLE